jgi:hypothetical protein
MTYKLTGADSKLKDHVGHKVEVSGTVDKSATGTSGSTSQPGSSSTAGTTGSTSSASGSSSSSSSSSMSGETLKVQSVRMISETCS